ncbi:MAG: hypothetical protein WCW02_03005 [Candidatus Buchananbacteria bacterium]
MKKTKLPKIVFRYSWIYDDLRRRKAMPDFKYPEIKEIKKFTWGFEKYWRLREKKVLLAISQIFDLSWAEAEILVYVVGGGLSYSDPLTVSLRGGHQYFFNTIVHELIHRFLAVRTGDQEVSHVIKKWEKKYQTETITTKNHIIIYATLAKLHELLPELFGDKKERPGNSFSPEYVRAKEIAVELGYDNVLQQFKKQYQK